MTNLCYHCELPITSSDVFSDDLAGSVREYCCAGCQAITQMIEAGGFKRYYQLRDQPGNKPDEQEIDFFQVYDNPRMQDGWVTIGEISTAEFLVEGIQCAACIWLIETAIKQLPGVQSAWVNLSQSRLTVKWKSDLQPVSVFFHLLQKIGFYARPFSQSRKQEMLAEQRRILLKQLGVAAAFGMQVMVISVALYGGDWYGIDTGIKQFLERITLLLVLPILFYSAQPFYSAAVRHLKTRTAGMDLPVSIGITLAFLGSVWATFSKTGEIYFDSIAMFVFFLLAARYLELNARIKGSAAMDTLANAVPQFASRYSTNEMDNAFNTVPVAELRVGDRILVQPGKIVPSDGVLIDASSTFDEALLSGEHTPVLRTIGDQVLAGSINIDQAVSIRVNKDPSNTTLVSILQLAKAAHQKKPHVAQLAEMVASRFVIVILILASVVALYGLTSGANNWLSTTIAVLVVTCPCALSLATPLAITASINTLMQNGIFVARQHAIETLTKVNHMVFDKTGTLTNDMPKIIHVNTHSSMSIEACLQVAASIEQYSTHPIAQSFIKANVSKLLEVSPIQNFPGLGMSGTIDKTELYLGSAEFIRPILNSKFDLSQIEKPSNNTTEANTGTVFLANSHELLATFLIREEIKAGASKLVRYLQTRNIRLSILSGDKPHSVVALARQLGIDHAIGSCKPEQKLSLVEDSIKNSNVVAMIGDGINDSPALSRAHLSVACSGDVNLSAANADIVLINKSIESLQLAHHLAQRTSSVIKQNLGWAISYNICAVPAAIMGWVPPWLAGIGMALSSIIVVVNASRLNHIPKSRISNR